MTLVYEGRGAAMVVVDGEDVISCERQMELLVLIEWMRAGMKKKKDREGKRLRCCLFMLVPCLGHSRSYRSRTLEPNPPTWLPCL